MNRVLLDASALLALLSSSPGSEQVADLMPQAEISSVSLAEVGSALQRAGVPSDQMRAVLDGLGLRVHNFGRTTALMAADLASSPALRRLSLGARCCLALAIHLGLPVVTADPAWRGVEVGVEVRLIG